MIQLINHAGRAAHPQQYGGHGDMIPVLTIERKARGIKRMNIHHRVAQAAASINAFLK
jgi:hypothetical protein